MYKFFDRLGGILAGALSGIGAGFLKANEFWGNDFWTSDNSDLPILGIIAIILYLPTLPLFMAWHMCVGIYKGITGGTQAGISHVSEVHHQQQCEEYYNNEKILEFIDKLVIAPQNGTVLLTENEQTHFLESLNRPNRSEQSKEELDHKYKNYLHELNELRCPLTCNVSRLLVKIFN